MTATMNWNDLDFKATDVVKLIAGLTAGLLFMSSINNKVDNVGGHVADIRVSQVEFQKEYRVEKEFMRTQISTLSLEIKLLTQRVENLEKQK